MGSGREAGPGDDGGAWLDRSRVQVTEPTERRHWWNMLIWCNCLPGGHGMRKVCQQRFAGHQVTLRTHVQRCKSS